jgi:uncharacterized protein YqeY
MLVDQLKARMFQAMKAGDTLQKEILRVALGEITTDAARPGRKGNDEEAQGVLRKLMKSNEESLAVATDEPTKAALRREIDVLAEFLPRAMGEEDVLRALEPVLQELKASSNDGQATGIAMKHLKATGAVVDGKVVGAAVKRLRAT